jgi:hypothetical protein
VGAAGAEPALPATGGAAWPASGTEVEGAGIGEPTAGGCTVAVGAVDACSSPHPANDVAHQSKTNSGALPRPTSFMQHPSGSELPLETNQ